MQLNASNNVYFSNLTVKHIIQEKIKEKKRSLENKEGNKIGTVPTI